MLWDGGVPVPAVQKPPFIDPSFDNFLATEYITANFGKAPRVQNYSLTVQHTFKQFLFEAAFVAHRAKGLNSTIDFNQVDPKYLSLGNLLTQPISSPAVRAAGFVKPFSAFPDNRSLAQALRPYPQYLDIQARNTGDGRTWYDALQTKVERRFGAWQMTGSYVWSKSLGFLHYRQIFSQNGNVPAQNNYDLSVEKSLLPFDQPHVFNFLTSYTLPFGKGRKYFANNKALDMVVGNWNVAAIIKYQTPTPIRVAATNTLSNLLFTRTRRANLTGTPLRANGDRNSLDPGDPNVRWFTPCQVVNNACKNGTAPFANPLQDLEFGSAGLYYSDFRNPRTLTENISIAKTLRVFEKETHFVQLRYRADMFNILNRTNFAVDTNWQGVNFGRATGPQVGARLITMGLQLEF